MVFRTGKYAGMTASHVNKVAPWYIKWVRENRPEMLKDHTSKKRMEPQVKKVVERVEPPEDDGSYKIQPNLDFGSEWK